MLPERTIAVRTSFLFMNASLLYRLSLRPMVLTLRNRHAILLRFPEMRSLKGKSALDNNAAKITAGDSIHECVRNTFTQCVALRLWAKGPANSWRFQRSQEKFCFMRGESQNPRVTTGLSHRKPFSRAELKRKFQTLGCRERGPKDQLSSCRRTKNIIINGIVSRK